MSHCNSIEIIFHFIKLTPPFVESKSIIIPPEAGHRDVLECASLDENVDIFDESAGRRLKGKIIKKLYPTDPVGTYGIQFFVLED